MLNELVTEACVRLTTRREDEDGQTLIEYGLIVGVVAMVSVVLLTTIGTKVPAFFTTAASKLHS